MWLRFVINQNVGFCKHKQRRNVRDAMILLNLNFPVNARKWHTAHSSAKTKTNASIFDIVSMLNLKN